MGVGQTPRGVEGWQCWSWGSATLGGSEVTALGREQGTEPAVTSAQPLPAAPDAAWRRIRDMGSGEEQKKSSFQTLGLPLHTDVLTLPNGNLCQIGF